jgi:hypothetical protein
MRVTVSRRPLFERFGYHAEPLQLDDNSPSLQYVSLNASKPWTHDILEGKQILSLSWTRDMAVADIQQRSVIRD